MSPWLKNVIDFWVSGWNYITLSMCSHPLKHKGLKNVVGLVCVLECMGIGVGMYNLFVHVLNERNVCAPSWVSL